MNLEELTGFFTAIAPAAKPLDARLRFDFGEEGCVSIDATTEPVVVSNNRETADTVFHADFSRFTRMLSGDLQGDMEFVMGRLRVEGDLITGVKVTQLLNRD